MERGVLAPVMGLGFRPPPHAPLLPDSPTCRLGRNRDVPASEHLHMLFLLLSLPADVSLSALTSRKSQAALLDPLVTSHAALFLAVSSQSPSPRLETPPGHRKSVHPYMPGIKNSVTATKRWAQPTCPSTDENMNKTMFIHTGNTIQP